VLAFRALRSRFRYPFRALGLGLGILGFVGLVFFGGRCPTAWLFHVPCPSCGSTRSVHGVLHGDLGEALRMNPVALLALPLFGALAVVAMARVAEHGTLQAIGRGVLERRIVAVLLGLYGLEVALWVLRFAGLFGGPVPV